MNLAATPPPPSFNANIVELTGFHVERNIRQLGNFEVNFAGLIQEGQNSFVASTLLDTGEHPGALCNPGLKEVNGDASHKFQAHGAAKDVADEFRDFCFHQSKLVERAIHGQLSAVFEGLTPAERQMVRFHSIMTVNRSSTTAELQDAHADSFDGTICAFALMSNKIGTLIYPAAQVQWRNTERTEATTPREQFDREMNNSANQPRPGALRYDDAQLGPVRKWRDGSCLILPPSVCHQIAAHNAVDPNDHDETFDSSGNVLAGRTDKRWFSRVTMEIIPEGPNARREHGNMSPFQLHTLDAWPEGLREKICGLVKDNIWGSL